MGAESGGTTPGASRREVLASAASAARQATQALADSPHAHGPRSFRGAQRYSAEPDRPRDLPLVLPHQLKDFLDRRSPVPHARLSAQCSVVHPWWKLDTRSWNFSNCIGAAHVAARGPVSEIDVHMLPFDSAKASSNTVMCPACACEYGVDLLLQAPVAQP
jgi:hypothetical protein